MVPKLRRTYCIAHGANRILNIRYWFLLASSVVKFRRSCWVVNESSWQRWKRYARWYKKSPLLLTWCDYVYCIELTVWALSQKLHIRASNQVIKHCTGSPLDTSCRATIQKWLQSHHLSLQPNPTGDRSDMDRKSSFCGQASPYLRPGLRLKRNLLLNLPMDE